MQVPERTPQLAEPPGVPLVHFELVHVAVVVQKVVSQYFAQVLVVLVEWESALQATVQEVVVQSSQSAFIIQSDPTGN